MNIIQYRERANKGALNEHGGQKGGQKVSEKTIDTILRYIKDNPYITRKALGEKTGISTSAIQKHINRLKADGIIVRHGGDRGGYWFILKCVWRMIPFWPRFIEGSPRDHRKIEDGGRGG